MSVTNIFSWNCRGAASKSFITAFKSYANIVNFSIAVIVEPKISGHKAEKVIWKMGFASSFRSDAIGFSGGVWLLWDPLVVSLNIMEFGPQFVHAKGSLADGSSFFLTAVYASPRATSRVLLWDVLKRLSVNQSSPWAVIGDFNAILSADDKSGGSSFERRRSKSFIDTIDLCRLSDLPFSGPRFTWRRQRNLTRIDRAFVNDAWIDLLPESSILHLHKIKSDHRPIVLCPTFQVFSSNSKPFCFISGWLSHPSFNFFVKNKFDAGKDLPGGLEGLSSDLKKWSKNVFGNIFKRKKRLMDSLVKAEEKSAANPSDGNLREESLVRSKLELTLWQEEALWVQKSRSKWAVEGDRNTKFFHLAALKRRAVNRIKRLKDSEGSWIEDQKSLLDMAVSFFEDIYTAQDGPRSRRVHNVNWETVCKSKSLGGLGLRSARELNQAFLMKVAWGIISQPNELWVQTLVTKYLVRTEFGFTLKRKAGFSALWRGVLKVWNYTLQGIQWSIKNGRKTRFWLDRWLDSGIILRDFALNSQGVDLSHVLADFILPNGTWNLEALSGCLPNEVVVQVMGMTHPCDRLGEDSIAWGLEANGCFSVVIFLIDAQIPTKLLQGGVCNF
ncbi:Putative ribonuclease H protein At1g65750 [Linum perenne]